MNNRASVEIGLTAHYSILVDTAKRDKLWFYGRKFGLDYWYHPKEFNKLLFEGGEWLTKINWTLRPVQERIQQIKLFREELKQELEDIGQVLYEDMMESKAS